MGQRTVRIEGRHEEISNAICKIFEILEEKSDLPLINKEPKVLDLKKVSMKVKKLHNIHFKKFKARMFWPYKL